MMISHISHIQLNISDARISLPFYKELLKFFEYRMVDESEEHIGMSNRTTDFWIIQTEDDFLHNKFHRKNTGINHVCFRLGSKEEVDEFCKEFLEKRRIATLYGTPKAFPEYTPDYYAVFFEDPDGIKIEVAFYTPSPYKEELE
jgi:catechol 2,3-dioxygenase-like lactoylglutathione lyase family enzyme